MCIQSSKTSSSPNSTLFRPPLAFKRTNRFSRVQRKEKKSSPSVVEKVDNKQKEQKNDVFGLTVVEKNNNKQKEQKIKVCGIFGAHPVKPVGIYRKPRRLAASKPAPFASRRPFQPIDLPKRPKRIVAPKPTPVVPQRRPTTTIQTNVNVPPQKNVIVSPDGLRPMQRNMGCPPMNRNTPPEFMQPQFYPQPPYPQNFYPQPPYPQNFYPQPQNYPQNFYPQPQNYYGPGYQPQNQTFSQMRPINHQPQPQFYPQTQPQSQFYPQTQPYPQFYPQQPQPFRPFSNETPYQPQNSHEFNGKRSPEQSNKRVQLRAAFSNEPPYINNNNPYLPQNAFSNEPPYINNNNPYLPQNAFSNEPPYINNNNPYLPQNDIKPGTYEVIVETRARNGIDVTSSIMKDLNLGDIVTIVQVEKIQSRQRGRLEKGGWMTLSKQVENGAVIHFVRLKPYC